MSGLWELEGAGTAGSAVLRAWEEEEEVSGTPKDERKAMQVDLLPSPSSCSVHASNTAGRHSVRLEGKGTKAAARVCSSRPHLVALPPATLLSNVIVARGQERSGGTATVLLMLESIRKEGFYSANFRIEAAPRATDRRLVSLSHTSSATFYAPAPHLVIRNGALPP